MRSLLLATSMLCAAPALPCDPSVSSAGFSVIPADGTPGVPTDVTPFAVGADLELLLRDASGNDLPASIEDMVLSGVGGVELMVRRALPLDAIASGTEVLVFVDGAVQSTFTVGEAPAASPPAGPEAVLDGVSQGQGGADTCGSFATIGVAGEDAAFFIGVVDGQPTVGARARWDGATSSDQLYVFAEGQHTVNVAGVDFAGRVGAAVPVEIDVPAALACACASSARGAAPWAALLSVLAPALFPRRFGQRRLAQRAPASGPSDPTPDRRFRRGALQ
ncbi:MAG: hypothetical protein HYS27_12040 [Deltaproteobacteria bacterium]|nr:hypothetical protein [Deltaproteobacteria bacterium]